MDLYIFCLVLGAAGMAAMAFLGFSSSHSAGHPGHDTSGHELHGVGGQHSISAGHGHVAAPAHGIAHGHHVSAGADAAHTSQNHAGHIHADAWKSHVWSWLSPRVLFNVLVGFGATGVLVERLVGPVL